MCVAKPMINLDLGQFIPAICKKWDGSSLALPHLKTLESRGPATQCGKPCIQTHCALCDATAQQARATRPHSGNHQAILVSNVARCYFHSFSGQIHGIFPSPDFSRCMYVYLYIYLSLSLASACSTIALLFVSRLFARKTRRKFVQISSQKYREKRLPTNIKPSTGELCKWLTVWNPLGNTWASGSYGLSLDRCLKLDPKTTQLR